jgi:putative ABC transport system ATP-binding protein
MTAAQRDRFRGRTIGMVLQQFHLLPSLTALQNLTVAQSAAGGPVDRGSAIALLEALGVKTRPNAFPHQLSVGQQQRVAIARALVNRPALVLADEPTSNLDDEACDRVARLLLDASREHGTALIIATHDGRLRARFANELRLARRELEIAA